MSSKKQPNKPIETLYPSHMDGEGIGKVQAERDMLKRELDTLLKTSALQDDTIIELKNQLSSARKAYGLLRLVYTTADSALTEEREKYNDLSLKLQKWIDVFGHLGTADEAGNEWFYQSGKADKLFEASKAVIARWESPLWKYVEPTGNLIHALRIAVNEYSADLVNVDPP